MAAGCPGATVGGYQPRNPDRRAQGNSRRPSGQGPGARLSNGFTAQGPPASRAAPTTLPPARPHRRPGLHVSATPARDQPHRQGISPPATITPDETALNATTRLTAIPARSAPSTPSLNWA